MTSVGTVHSETSPRDPAPPDALIVGHYGYRNLGDEAILAGILGLLRETTPGGRWMVSSGDPEDTRSRHDVPAVNRSDAPAVLEEAGRSQMVIVGGGDLSDRPGSGPGNACDYLATAQAAARAGKPVLVWGVGVGPLEDPASRRRVEALAEASSAFTVATNRDRTALESLGIADALVVGDPALLLGRAELPPDLNGTLSDVPRPLIAVTPRSWGAKDLSAERERHMARALDGFCEENGGTVLFVPMQEWRSGEFDDRACCDRIAEGMRAPDIRTVPPDLGPGQVITALGRSDMALNMRLHGTILAAMGRTPSVSISYHPKVARTAAEMGLGPWCVGDEPESWGRLSETLASLWQDYADQSHLMYEWAETMLAGARPVRSLLKNALGHG